MKTALLVIDAQKIYTDPNSELYCENSDEILNNINQLIKFYLKKEQPIYLIRHIHKIDGTDLGRMFDFNGELVSEFNFKEQTSEVEYDDALYQPIDAFHIVKTRYSAFIGTDLLKKLNNQKIERVVVCGFMTNFCCESTARDAHDRDFYVDFIIDATGTPGTESYDQETMRRIVSELLAEGFAIVKTTNEYIDKN